MIPEAMNPRPSHETFLQYLRAASELDHLFLMGGFAEDALLEQRITQERDDVDFLVRADSLDLARAELQRIGIVLEPMVRGPKDETLAFGSRNHGFPVEIWLATQTGEAYAVVLPGSAGYFRLHLPSDTFASEMATLEGVRLKTISPLALALFRAASAQTRGDETKRAADRRVLRNIAGSLLPNHRTAELTPKITVLYED